MSLPAVLATSLALLLGAGPVLAASESVIYDFNDCYQCNGDAYGPYSALTDVNGTFYGTSGYGGAQGVGTVFSVTPAGAETILHSFAGGTDGLYPSSPLVSLNGTLYGLTCCGGALGNNGYGTFYSITPGGVHNVIYSFRGGTDVSRPYTLTYLKGKFYGIGAGGTNGAGTFFSITPAGVEKTLYSFKGGADGAPFYGLTAMGGALYGTTSDGANGQGSVVKLTTKGQVTTLYSFQGGTDGAEPQSPLLRVGPVLYGTTRSGGGCAVYSDGCGTVFAVSIDGAEKVVYAFQGDNDGYSPGGPLIVAGGKLYGTTVGGGGQHPLNQGTVFSLSLTGHETVLHSFGAAGDGSGPQEGVITYGGAVYGTTAFGGNQTDDGTVFAITLH